MTLVMMTSQRAISILDDVDEGADEGEKVYINLAQDSLLVVVGGKSWCAEIGKKSSLSSLSGVNYQAPLNRFSLSLSLSLPALAANLI